MRMRVEQSVLLVVDVQERLENVVENGTAAVSEVLWLVRVAQRMGVPVIATEHCPDKLGHSVPALRPLLPAAAVVGKTHFSAVSEGGLFRAPEGQRVQWIVAGMEAHVCVMQTVLDLLELGREVFVVDEAVASRQARDKALALERMRRHGADIVSREMVAFEWLAHAGAPEFRSVLRGFIR